MPETIDYIEKNGKYDVLEIFRRGKVPSEPELIYGRLNKKTEEKTNEVIKEKKFVTKNNQTYGYTTAKESILKSREEDYDIVIPGCEKRFKEIKINMDTRKKDDSANIDTDEMKKSDKMFFDLMKYYENLKKKRELSNNNMMQDGEEQEER